MYTYAHIYIYAYIYIYILFNYLVGLLGLEVGQPGLEIQVVGVVHFEEYVSGALQMRSLGSWGFQAARVGLKRRADA